MRTSFMRANPGSGASPEHLAPSRPIYERFGGADLESGLKQVIDRVDRGDFASDPTAATRTLLAEIQRGITSSMSGFPAREHLEAEAKILVPTETPLRNRLPRSIGSGLASRWQTVSSFGTGFGTATVTVGATNAANTFKVENATGFYPGETLLYDGTVEHKITTVDTANKTISVASTPGIAANGQIAGKSLVKTSFFHPESGVAKQTFFSETGAPAEKTSTYVEMSASYKLLGEMGSVTAFAMAAGANFQNQLAAEKRNRLYSLMLAEENALLNGDSLSTQAPWGDGTQALSFDGMNTLIARHAPANHVQSAVGALTTAHLDAQLTRLYYQGGRNFYMVMNGQEVNSLAKLAQATGSVHRIMIDSQGGATIGISVAYYVHPISGERVPILVSRFQPAGWITFGSDFLPDGSPAADVEVLPQVFLPDVLPHEGIQGYVAQEIAPDRSSPNVFPFLVSVFEVLRLKSYNVFALSRGVAPA